MPSHVAPCPPCRRVSGASGTDPRGGFGQVPYDMSETVVGPGGEPNLICPASARMVRARARLVLGDGAMEKDTFSMI